MQAKKISKNSNLKNLENYGVQELNAREITQTNGGRSWWQHAKQAYADLTDDMSGMLVVAIFSKSSLIGVVCGATYNYFNE